MLLYWLWPSQCWTTFKKLIVLYRCVSSHASLIRTPGRKTSGSQKLFCSTVEMTTALQRFPVELWTLPWNSEIPLHPSSPAGFIPLAANIRSFLQNEQLRKEIQVFHLEFVHRSSKPNKGRKMHLMQQTPKQHCLKKKPTNRESPFGWIYMLALNVLISFHWEGVFGMTQRCIQF